MCLRHRDSLGSLQEKACRLHLLVVYYQGSVMEGAEEVSVLVGWDSTYDDAFLVG